MELVRKYFPELNPEKLEQLQELSLLVTDWNNKINLISRKDIPHIFERHILHSLAIARLINFQPGTRIMDIGTGGGFPGLPLAVVFPGSQFTLVDSIAKKIKVVDDIKEKMNLENVIPLNIRAEKVQEKFHFVVSRAVTAFPSFYNLVKGKISGEQFNSLSNGILYLKGGDFSGEIAPFGKIIKVHRISDFFDEEFFETKKIIYLPQ